jgi:5-methylthioribose kinase
MRKINTNTGYSQEVAREYVNVSGEFQLITLLEDKLKYDDESKKFTDEFSHQIGYFTQKELYEPFKVKFETKQNLSQFDVVELIDLEACIVNKNVYFRAKESKVLK